MWALRKRRTRKLNGRLIFDGIAAAGAAERRVAASYTPGEVAVLKNGRGGHVVIHPSTKHPGQYQVTYCNQTGFICDSTLESIHKAVRQCLIEGYRTRLEPQDAEALMLAIVEAEAKYQRCMRRTPNLSAAET
jgi:hypothetical protein